MNLGEVYRIESNAEGAPMAQRWKFWNPDKFWPCQQPPWGELTAIDVNTGDIVWRVPLGEFAELAALGVPKTGAPNIGGSIVTAGGARIRGWDSGQHCSAPSTPEPAKSCGRPTSVQPRTPCPSRIRGAIEGNT